MDVDHFLQGSEYSNHRDVPRKQMCATCAFRKDSPVRPADFDWDEFQDLCWSVTSFVCHEKESDGFNLTCAAWHKQYGPSLAQSI